MEAETASLALAELSIGADDVHARKSSCSVSIPFARAPVPAACTVDKVPKEGGEAEASSVSKVDDMPYPFPGLGGRLRRPVVAVVGSGRETHAHLAAPLGRWLASIGVHLLTGGGRGVMEEVSRHFFEVEDRKGLAIGVLPTMPGCSRPPLGYPNPFVELAIQTHLPLGRDPMGSHSRSHISVMTADVVVALPGAKGTWTEVQLSSWYKRPIILFLGEQSRSLACEAWAYSGDDAGAAQAKACPCDTTAPQCACSNGQTCMGLPIAFALDEVQTFVMEQLALAEARRERRAAREAEALALAAATPRRIASCGASAVRAGAFRTRSTSV